MVNSDGGRSAGCVESGPDPDLQLSSAVWEAFNGGLKTAPSDELVGMLDIVGGLKGMSARKAVRERIAFWLSEYSLLSVLDESLRCVWLNLKRLLDPEEQIKDTGRKISQFEKMNVSPLYWVLATYERFTGEDDIAPVAAAEVEGPTKSWISSSSESS